MPEIDTEVPDVKNPSLYYIKDLVLMQCFSNALPMKKLRYRGFQLLPGRFNLTYLAVFNPLICQGGGVVLTTTKYEGIQL